MIKVSVYTDKNLTSGKKSLSVLRVRKDGKDVDMKSIVVDGEQTVNYTTMLTLKAALFALDGSVDVLEFNVNDDYSLKYLKWDKTKNTWSKKNPTSGVCKDLVVEFRQILPPESFKIRKLHPQEAAKMKLFGEEQLEKLKELADF